MSSCPRLTDCLLQTTFAGIAPFPMFAHVRSFTYVPTLRPNGRQINKRNIDLVSSTPICVDTLVIGLREDEFRASAPASIPAPSSPHSTRSTATSSRQPRPITGSKLISATRSLSTKLDYAG